MNNDINEFQHLYYSATDNSKQYQVKDDTYSNGVKMTVLNTTVDRDIDVSSYGFKTNMFRQGISPDINVKKVEQCLKNPEANKKILSQLSKWYYISNGEVFQLYDLARVLSSLDYKINCIEKDSKYDKNVLSIKKELRKVNHKEISRDIITQLVTTGTVVGLWLDDNGEYYPYVFDDLEYIFPAYREKGKWVIWFDLAYLNTFSDIERTVYLEGLKPYVTIDDYNNYVANSTKCRYIQFPIERSICIRTHTVSRNQRFGIPWSTQAIGDLNHKKKLKDLEKSVANKIINATAILTIGDETNPNLKLGKNAKTKVFGGVKKALTENEEDGGISVVAIPEWAKMEFQKIGKEPLDPDKFESVNSDVQNDLGYAKGLITGNEGNYASNNLSLTIFYMKLGEILENIESEVFNKLINLLLKDKYSDVYYLEYDKSIPLDKKTKLTTLSIMEAQGYTIKPILELMGIDYMEYIEQSKYEIETLKLREKITPPMNTNNISANDPNKTSGRTEDTSNLNDNTVISKEQNGNLNPKPTNSK